VNRWRRVSELSGELGKGELEPGKQKTHHRSPSKRSRRAVGGMSQPVLRLRTTSQLLDPVYNLSPLKSLEHDGIAPRDRTVLPGAAGVYHSCGCHRLETRRRESVRPPAIRARLSRRAP
jgi:hypothetical protein